MPVSNPPAVRPARPSLVVEHLVELLSQLQPGDRLPSEAALGQQFGYSRNTVREALAALQRDGAVIREQGRGTFKAPPRQHLHASLNRILPIPDVIRRAGYLPRVNSWSQRDAPVDEAAASALGVPAGTVLRLIELLYLADDRPAVQVTYSMAPQVMAAVPGWSDFSPEEGVLPFLQRQLPGRLSHSSTRIAAVRASRAMAARLQVQEGDPLLRFVSLGVAVTGEPLYHSVSYQSGDLLDVHILRPVDAGERTSDGGTVQLGMKEHGAPAR